MELRSVLNHFVTLQKKLQTFIEQMLLQKWKERDPLNSAGVTEYWSSNIFLSCTRIDDLSSFSDYVLEKAHIALFK